MARFFHLNNKCAAILAAEWITCQDRNWDLSSTSGASWINGVYVQKRTIINTRWDLQFKLNFSHARLLDLSCTLVLQRGNVRLWTCDVFVVIFTSGASLSDLKKLFFFSLLTCIKFMSVKTLPHYNSTVHIKKEKTDHLWIWIRGAQYVECERKCG